MCTTPPAPQQVWRFYTSDDDHSTDWTNHGYSMHLVVRAEGENPQDAWQNAVLTGQVPEQYDLNYPPTVAVLEHNEIEVDLTPVMPRFRRTVTYEIQAASQEEADEIWDEHGPEIAEDRRLTLAELSDITVVTAAQ